MAHIAITQQVAIKITLFVSDEKNPLSEYSSLSVCVGEDCGVFTTGKASACLGISICLNISAG